MATLSKTVLWKRRRKSWKTMPMLCRSWWISWSGILRTLMPSMTIWPSVGRISRKMILSRVVLPGAARPGDEAEIALLDLEGDVGQGPVGGLVLLPDVEELDHQMKRYMNQPKTRAPPTMIRKRNSPYRIRAFRPSRRRSRARTTATKKA